jgi:carbon monoxide dehydrogenase subunit G
VRRPMRLEGKTTIAAPREKVWAFLTDPISVSRCTPGFESIEVVVPGRKFRALAAVGLGTVKARFATEVEWLDLVKPSHARMKAHGTAPVGAADVTTEMTLADGPSGSTELTWTAEVTVVGTIAAHAARLLKGISTKLTNAFFACVRRKVEVGAEEPERPARRRRRKRI